MNKFSLLALLLTLPLAAIAQKNAASHFGEFTLEWTDGMIDLRGPTPSGKATLTVTGTSQPVALIAQVSGGEALKKANLKSRRQELRGYKIVAVAVNTNTKGKKAFVTGATITRDVTVLVEQVTLSGDKTTYKVRCDQATFKAGAKLGTGRLDFSGDVHAWGFGGPLSSGELKATSGWIDLGDPDDPENQPIQTHLDRGSATILPSGDKKK